MTISEKEQKRKVQQSVQVKDSSMVIFASKFLMDDIL